MATFPILHLETKKNNEGPTPCFPQHTIRTDETTARWRRRSNVLFEHGLVQKITEFTELQNVNPTFRHHFRAPNKGRKQIFFREKCAVDRITSFHTET